MGDSGASRRFYAGSVGGQIDDSGVGGQNRFVVNSKLILRVTAPTVYEIVGLISVRIQVVNIQEQVRALGYAAERSRIVVGLQQPRVKRTVGDGPLNALV